MSSSHSLKYFGGATIYRPYRNFPSWWRYRRQPTTTCFGALQLLQNEQYEEAAVEAQKVLYGPGGRQSSCHDFVKLRLRGSESSLPPPFLSLLATRSSMTCSHVSFLRPTRHSSRARQDYYRRLPRYRGPTRCPTRPAWMRSEVLERRWVARSFAPCFLI